MPPSVIRLLACAIYEALLFIAIALVLTFIYIIFQEVLLPQIVTKMFLPLYLWVLLGVYFVYQWVQTGQTLAMKTWRIQLVNAQSGALLTYPQAIKRYLICSALWLPALASAWVLRAPPRMVVVGLVWYFLLFWVSKLRSDRRLLQDFLAVSKLVTEESHARQK